jgi:hypothetical protein
MVAGEVHPLKGIEGMKRAKDWLSYSTRVATIWTCTETVVSDLLEFRWPYGGTFNFDLGGKLRGGDLDGQSFMAEVKAYRNESDLPEKYRHFVAECYVAFQLKPKSCDHLMWISWAPFQALKWDIHRTPNSIRTALLHKSNRMRLFNTEDEKKAERLVNEAAVFEISRRIWLITLCDEQEGLVITNEHFGELMKFMKVSQEI